MRRRTTTLPALHVHIGLLLVVAFLLATECSGFAAKKGGGGKRNRAAASKSKSGGGGGFGSAPAEAKPPPPPAPSDQEPELQEIILGPAKTVYINVPPDQLAPSQMSAKDRKKLASAAGGSAATRAALLDQYSDLRGRGDVLWPSSLQLARLIANCPSFVAGRRCIDVGAGLGLASLAVLLGNPSRLVVSDVDDEVLQLAMRSCKEQIEVMPKPSIKSVERRKLDWSDPSTWPPTQGEFDLACASDVLYDADAAGHIAKLLAHLLAVAEPSADNSDGEEEIMVARALIVDPSNRQNRDVFVEEAARNGLDAEVLPFPGNEDEFRLISVTRSEP